MPNFGSIGATPGTYPKPPVQQGVYGGIQNVGVQNYLPIMEKRESLEKPEQKQVKEALHHWLPRIGAGYSTPMPELLASPTKSAILSGAGTALLFAAGGLVMIEKKAAALVGGAIGAGVGAFSGFISRRQSNENILDLMQRMPEGATKRDYDADPAHQAELNRSAMRAGNSGGDLFTTMMVASMFNGGNRRR
jgi:hypothetical protein